MIDQNIKTMVINAPVPINFAGLRGTTMSMQSNGWEIAAETTRSQDRYGHTIRLTGRHRDLGLYFYSGIAQFDYHHIASSSSLINPALHMEFPIKAFSQSMLINISEPSSMPVYSAVDFSTPFNSSFDMRKVSIEDLVPFKSFNKEAEVYLPEKKIVSVQEYLNEILGDQKEKQKEIREKRRKMNNSGEIDLYKKTESDIKLQLVAI